MEIQTTSMGNLTLRVNTLFEAGGRLAENNINGKMNLFQWVDEVYRIAKMELGVNATKNQEREMVELRRIVAYFAAIKFKVITIGIGSDTLRKLGEAVARAEHKQQAYSHCIVIHSIKKHVMHIENQNKGFKDYAHKYFKIKQILIDRRYLNQFDLNQQIKHTYTNQ